MPFKTTDLYDEHLETLQIAAPIFRDFGGKTRFHGQIVTLKALEDNSFTRLLLKPMAMARYWWLMAQDRCAVR